MNEWWTGLALEQQVYYGIAIVATAVVLVQLLLMMVGVGADELLDAGDIDLDGPDDDASGLHLLSTRTVSAFFMGFGWMGALTAGEGAPAAVTALAACVAGAFFGFVVFRLMGLLHSLRHSGTLDYANAVGEVGTVYLEIHPSMAVGGQIQVMVQGRLKVIQAVTRRDRAIEKGSRVQVVDQFDQGTLLVVPLTDPGSPEGE